MTEETKNKISLNNGMHKPENRDKIRRFRTGKHFWNDGKITVFAAECPEGFSKGMIRRKNNGPENPRRP